GYPPQQPGFPPQRSGWPGNLPAGGDAQLWPGTPQGGAPQPGSPQPGMPQQGAPQPGAQQPGTPQRPRGWASNLPPAGGNEGWPASPPQDPTWGQR
ncbi:MAG TPA: hypothetical protein VF807_04975, partial [Ktedonobacterales bacterium]